jgi:membrane-associated phospholipid phosphatase
MDSVDILLSIFCGVFSSGVYKPNANAVRAMLIPPTIISLIQCAPAISLGITNTTTTNNIHGVHLLRTKNRQDFYVEYNHLNRASPTMLIGEAVRLSSMYPDFGLKDYSGDSFPGDHAAVLTPNKAKPINPTNLSLLSKITPLA